jgi:hypothetical protein
MRWIGGDADDDFLPDITSVQTRRSSLPASDFLSVLSD